MELIAGICSPPITVYRSAPGVSSAEVCCLQYCIHLRCFCFAFCFGHLVSAGRGPAESRPVEISLDKQTLLCGVGKDCLKLDSLQEPMLHLSLGVEVFQARQQLKRHIVYTIFLFGIFLSCCFCCMLLLSTSICFGRSVVRRGGAASRPHGVNRH